MSLAFLEQPYPYEDSFLHKLRALTGVAGFSFLFLWYFEPFGIHSIDESVRFGAIVGYTLVVLIVMSVNMFLVPRLFPGFCHEENWTVLREILFAAYGFVAVGIGLFLYSSYRIEAALDLHNFLRFQWYSFIVGIVPVTILILLHQVHALKKNLALANELNAEIASGGSGNRQKENSNSINLTSENEKESVAVSLMDLLYIHSVDNYVYVYWRKQDAIQKKLLRTSLKRLENLVGNYPPLFRCHRAYLVNLQRV